jgi:LysM repeat protein
MMNHPLPMEFSMSRNQLAIRVSLLVIILVAAMGSTPVFAQGAAVVRVDPSTLSIQASDTANIAIKVDSVTNLTAIELHLAFDPSVLEVTSLSNGGFVAADFEAQNTFSNSAGTIDYAIAQMNRPPAQGSGTLLNISLRAKANGSSPITTRATPAAPGGLLLSDPNGMAIQASWIPGSVSVGSSTSVTNTPGITFTALPITNTPTPTLTSYPMIHTPTATSTSIAYTPANTSTSAPASNTPTNTPVSNTPAPPSGTPGIHIVRWGEWLYCIARAYRVAPSAIIESNRLWWPYIIFPNQKLTIPNVPWTNMTAGPVCKAQFTSPTPPPTPTVTPVTSTPVIPVVTVTPPTVTPIPATTAAPSVCRAVYVVRPGDTLYSIARRYGTNYMEVARVNGIPNPRLIYPGQRLCIP